MPSLKELRNRIDSVKATQKITKAMQMVAAAKLRRAQDALVAARPFSKQLDRVLAALALPNLDQLDVPLLLGTGGDTRHLLVVCTAERGLCGGFNSSIVRLVREHADRLVLEGKSVEIVCIGRKGYEALKRTHGRHIVHTVELRGVRRLAFSHGEEHAREILERFSKGSFDIATLFYGEFRSVISQIPRAVQIVPVPVAPLEEPNFSPDGFAYTCEPGREEVLNTLLPQRVATGLFQALLENAASEQGARMSAMDNATRNAGDMIARLSLSYNRQRQAQITKELIEIISGAEAV